MGARALGVAAVLAAAGLAAGGAIGFGQRPPVADFDPPRQVPAESPSVPIDPPLDPAEDPAVAALATGLPTQPATVGGEFGVTVPVPVGWTRQEISPNEAGWRVASNPTHTYSLWVTALTGDRVPIPMMRDTRLEFFQQHDEFHLRTQSDDEVVFAYLNADRHRRLQMTRWLQLRGTGTAEVEITVAGRIEDRTGLTDLLRTVTAGARIPS